ncbi:MAG: DUF5018 domain-containing protein [bacterium]|nr:DUF5018 domain-containing protein [bacterium]
MKYTKLLFAFSMVLIILPIRNIYASSCSPTGYTIFTINGILNSEIDAIKNRDKLRSKYSTSYNKEPLTIDYLYNPTHLAGANDFIDVIQQGLFQQKSDYDLVEMLSDASEKVKTQKLLLVAHSQGNFYANNFYEKVVSQPGGVPGKSIGVYGVGSPAGWVAGGGKYLTSDTDSVIAATAARYFSILKPNVHIELKPEDGNGHGFADVYLKYQGNKIVSDIKLALSSLKKNDEQPENEPCISQPELTALHKIQGAFLYVADPAAIGIKTGLAASYKAGEYVRDKVGNAGLAIGNAINKVAVSIGKLAKNLSANVSESLPDAGSLATGLPATNTANAENDNSSPESEPASVNLNTETVMSDPNQKENKTSDAAEEVEEKVVSKDRARRSGGGGGSESSVTETEETPAVPDDDPIPEADGPEPEEPAPETEPVVEPDPEAAEEPEPEPEDVPVSNVIYSQPDSSVEISSAISSFDTFTGKSGHIQGIRFAYNDAGNSAGKFVGVAVVDRSTGINYYGTEEGGTCGNTYESTGVNEKVIVELDSSVHFKEHPCTGPDLVLDPLHTYGVALFANNFVDDDIRFYGESNANDAVYLEITDDSIPSTGKAIKSFKLPDLGAAGVIDEDSHQIVISVPFGTDIAALAPVIRISGGASISPASEEQQNFSNPVSYTVTAENGETETYEIAVSVRPNIVYSQPDNSIEIVNRENISIASLFTGAQGEITDLKFSYNDKGADQEMWIGVKIVDQTGGKSYYAWKDGFSEYCGDAYQSHKINAPVIAELGSDYEYREYPCTGSNLVLDPTHTYGVNLFRNRGGNGTQRFYGSSNANDDAYMYIESDGAASSPAPEPDSSPEIDPIPDVATPEITSYTFNGTEGDITVDPVANPITLFFTASENVDWVSVIIENENDAGVDKQFRSGNNCEDGTSTCEKIWDGTLSGGGNAPEGVYRVKVHIKDADSNAFQEFLENTITVDFSITEEELVEAQETSDQGDLKEETAVSEDEINISENTEDLEQENIDIVEVEEDIVDDYQSNDVPDPPVGQL